LLECGYLDVAAQQNVGTNCARIAVLRKGRASLAIIEEEFEHSQAFQWLIQNAHKFGFRLSYPRGNKFGIAYEPWHWFYEGNAQQDRGGNSD
jgi:hypothetical protein